MEKEQLERRIANVSERLADAKKEDRQPAVERLTGVLAELKAELKELAPVVEKFSTDNSEPVEEKFSTDKSEEEFS